MVSKAQLLLIIIQLLLECVLIALKLKRTWKTESVAHVDVIIFVGLCGQRQTPVSYHSSALTFNVGTKHALQESMRLSFTTLVRSAERS